MKGFWKIALIGVSIIFSGCSGGQVAAAKASVERQLIDPTSAQYRDMTSFTEDVVCGSVNSKNRMGGYVGFRLFIYNGPSSNQADFDIDQGDVDLWCNDNPDKRKTAADRDNERRSHRR